MKKTIKKASLAGFCYGVKRALDLTIQIKNQNPEKNVYVLGELIHNSQVIEELLEKGIEIIHSVEEIKNPHNSICIIRTHGATPQEIKEIQERGCQILDATCVDVKMVQEKAKSLIKEGYKLFIVGKEDHPEVIGIKAHAEENSEEKAIILSSKEQVKNYEEEIKKAKKIGIVSQITQKTENLQDILSELIKFAKEIKVYNTICTTTAKRQSEAKLLAKEVDLMIVVGSHSSANTSHLYEILKDITETIHIETEKELSKYKTLLEKAQNIGVTAGASTPEFIINKVIETIELKGE